MQCNEENIEGAIKFCQTVNADMGGTEILKPMRNIVLKRKPNHRTRVFCFTDGCVSNSGEVIKLSADKNIIVHSIGIGNGCDRNMLESMAKTGRGSCSLIKDDEGQSVLGGKVIQALHKSLEPALEHCTLQVGHALREMDTIFRGQLVRESKIISTAEFEDLKVKFECRNNPVTNEPISLEF